jgi:DNA mismatch repair protein MSH5
MTEEERSDLENAESVCRRFLAWNLQDELKNRDEGGLSVKAKLAAVLGLDFDGSKE